MEGSVLILVLSPSSLETSRVEEPGRSTLRAVSVEEAAARTSGMDDPPSAQTPSQILSEYACSFPLADRTGVFEKNEETDEEDHNGIGAVALEGTEGGIIPPGMSPTAK